MPRKWTSPSQKLLLWGYLGHYQALRAENKDMSTFHGEVKDTFFERFPECLFIWGIPGEPMWAEYADRPTPEEAKVNDLTPEDLAHLKIQEAIRKDQVSAWFVNHKTHDPAIENTTSKWAKKLRDVPLAVSLMPLLARGVADLERRFQAPCYLNIYMKTFLERFAKLYQEMWERKLVSSKGVLLPKVSVQKMAAKICWAKEEASIREKINVLQEEKKKIYKGERDVVNAVVKQRGLNFDRNAARTPQEYNLSITAMGLGLMKWADHLAWETGGYLKFNWSGPIASLGGQLRTYRVSAGPRLPNNDTYREWRDKNADEDMANYDEGVKKPFLRYSRKVFPKEVRDSDMMTIDEDNPLALGSIEDGEGTDLILPTKEGLEASNTGEGGTEAGEDAANHTSLIDSDMQIDIARQASSPTRSPTPVPQSLVACPPAPASTDVASVAAVSVAASTVAAASTPATTISVKPGTVPTVNGLLLLAAAPAHIAPDAVTNGTACVLAPVPAAAPTVVPPSVNDGLLNASIVNPSQKSLPDSLVKYRECFEALKFSKEWSALVLAWINLEEVLGFPNSKDGSGCLTDDMRSQQVTDSLSQLRPLHVPASIKSVDATEFTTLCRAWWNAIIPAWKITGKPEPASDAWSTVTKGSYEGIVVWIVTLWWWCTVTRGRGVSAWTKMIREVTAVLDDAAKASRTQDQPAKRGTRKWKVQDNVVAAEDGPSRKLRTRCILCFLPTYSPDFNSIEQIFSSVKSWLRHNWDTAQNNDHLELLLLEACGQVTVEKARGWIQNSGYSF
ncbi:hypothetical protein M422DRAFT_245296 [Sphaerobolus stellatus SS14]|nr:hypothetical protein M422DRAFT_245296 [Sphaerobolus stellatus SS14]